MSRRTFLSGAATTILAGCTAQRASNEDLAPAISGSVALVALFAASGGEVQTGSTQRLPFAFADERGLLLTDLPDTVTVSVLRGENEILARTVVAVRHEGLSRPYVPVHLRPQDPGLHQVVADIGDEQAEAVFLVDPHRETRLVPGRRLPPVATPTFDRTRGVTPVCTGVPPCPLHDITVAAALDRRQPLAVLVASPGTCEISSCPPALELLLEAREGRRQIQFLHAEVYVDATETSSLARTTEAVRAFGVTAEPSLFLVDADGMIRHRLDHVFDASELDESLSSLE